MVEELTEAAHALRSVSRVGLALLSLCAGVLGCGDAEQRSSVLHVQGDQIVDGTGKAVLLRGVQFGNWIYADAADRDPVSTYADENDYARVAAMGASTIAFYIASDQFEDDDAPGQYKDSAFDWIDQHLSWAKAHGIRLILTLGAPPGSLQWATPCDGNKLWDVPDYQVRTAALWRALAARYANEPVIAGFDLLAVPLPSGSVQQWHDLASRLVSAVREVDRRHLLVVEPPYGENCAYKAEIDASDLFRVDDRNVLYEFAAQVPWSYVAQLLPSQSTGDGGSYPDDTALGDLDFSSACGDVPCMQYEASSYLSTPPEYVVALRPDETSWTEKAFAYRVTSSDYQIGIPILQSDNNSGKVYFDDFVVKEYDQDLQLVRTVMSIDPENHDDWYLWQGFADGSTCADCGAVPGDEKDAHSGSASISLSGSTSSANLSLSRAAFPTKLNYTYVMNGWLKGEHTDPKGSARFRLDFWKYNANGGVLPLRNKAALSLYLQSFIAWGKAQHVPLYVGDFGTGRPTFGGEKGGLFWAQDMIDLLKENYLHFAYDEYHGDDFGIYAGNHGLPDPATANQPVIDLLTRELAP